MNSSHLPPRIRVILSDDHAMVRKGVGMLLQRAGDIDIVGEADNGHEAVKLATARRPDVILMDIAMPSLDGLEATRRIRQIDPAARVVILSEDNDDVCLERAVAAGVAGFLEKQTATVDVILKAVRTVVRGQPYFSDAVVERWRATQRKRRVRDGIRRADGEKLSPRETEVLRFVAEGAANKRIAREMGISLKTVEKHRQHLMDKLDIHHTAGLTRYAIDAGVLACLDRGGAGNRASAPIHSQPRVPGAAFESMVA